MLAGGMRMPRNQSRRTEGSLLSFVLLILAAGFLLVFFGRTREGVPADALNINTAQTEELAITLEVDPAIADALVQYRQRHHGFSQTQEIASVPVLASTDVRSRAAAALEQSHLDVNLADARQLESVLDVPPPIARRIVNYRDSLPQKRFRAATDILRVPALDDKTIAAMGNRLIVRHPANVLWQFTLLTGLVILLFVAVPVLLQRAGTGGDPFLLPIAFLLSGFGVIALFSVKDPLRDTPVYAHHVFGLLLGLAAMLCGAWMPARMRRNLRHYTYVWALAALLLLIGLWLFGYGPERVRLSLAFFQPVEIIKLLLVLFMASYLAQRGDLLADALRRWRPPLPKGWLARYKGIAVPGWNDSGPILGMFLAALAMFLVVRDLGPALLLFGAFIGLLFLATGRTGIVWVGLLLMVYAGWQAYRWHVGVVPARVDMWRSPWDNSYPNGMQLGQSLWAMASGGWSGSGLGLGAPREMPRAGSDLVFASLSEELGLVGSLTLLLLYVLLVWRGLRIALRAQNDFDRLLASGLTALMACQVFLIVAGVTGLLPLTGITLPFVSYGNSSLVADFFLLGLLRGISAPTGSVPIGAPNPVFRRAVRQFVTATAFALLGLVGVGRMVRVQALAADEIAGQAIRTPDADGSIRAKTNPRLIAIERAVRRGSIYDRKGRVLATSRLDEISREVGDDEARARRLFRKGRYYPRGPYFAHLLGYLDPNIGGPTGLEKEFNADLRGFKTHSELLTDYRAKDLPGWLDWLTGRRPRTGKDLVLTLDADMQENAFRILKRAAGRLTDKRTGKPKDRAAMVVLDPMTGETLVSAAIPTFDPNDLTTDRWNRLVANEDRSHRLLDRARSGYYPPGSTLKVATGGAGLEEGIEPQYDCNHVAFNLRWTYRGQTYARRQLQDDRGDPPHNVIKMARAIRVSCNLYFAHLGLVLGPERLHRAFAGKDRWAFSRVKPLPVFAADLAENAFGQGTMLVTPTEMARVAASVADHGQMMQPVLWRELRAPGGKVLRRSIPKVMSRPLGPENAQRMAEMMRGVVTDGTARGVFDDIPVQVAGKTGTAQTLEGDGQPHSWFIGYAPFSRPQYAFACVIENGGYGKRGAAPAVNEMLRELFGR
jgi:cell division protein FtsI/penicillin-binding protein 2/cell division protein FtsW (lipid II flippase)/DNA uptake protein ComE-like DNA-binding protein